MSDGNLEQKIAETQRILALKRNKYTETENQLAREGDAAPTASQRRNIAGLKASLEALRAQLDDIHWNLDDLYHERDLAHHSRQRAYGGASADLGQLRRDLHNTPDGDYVALGNIERAISHSMPAERETSVGRPLRLHQRSAAPVQDEYAAEAHRAAQAAAQAAVDAEHHARTHNLNAAYDAAEDAVAHAAHAKEMLNSLIARTKNIPNKDTDAYAASQAALQATRSESQRASRAAKAAKVSFYSNQGHIRGVYLYEGPDGRAHVRWDTSSNAHSVRAVDPNEPQYLETFLRNSQARVRAEGLQRASSGGAQPK